MQAEDRNDEVPFGGIMKVMSERSGDPDRKRQGRSLAGKS